MKMLKKIIIGTFCFSMLTAGLTVSAASEEQELTDTVQQLTDAAEKLDPESEETVENFAELLDNWDVDTADSSGESDSLSGTMNISSSDLSQGNIQFIFAQLQQQQSQMCKDQANQYIEQIEKNQEDQKKCAELIELLRKLQWEIQSEGTSKPLTEEIKNGLVELEICSADDKVMSKNLTEAEVELLVSYAEQKQESEASATQQGMVCLQDYINQYNSYIQGASTAMNSASESLNYGGTMLGGSVGMLFTGILIGACAGIVIVLVVQKSRKKGA